MNVTVTATFVPAADAPKTMTSLVVDMIVHDIVAVPPTAAVQAPPCAGVIKFEPPMVMELD